ncbi:MFS transporter [Humibacillus sp. DSM 29435]|uniref:thiamine pyrophosphate-dependent enzyme n=1 Tax=Humibacillus sp. DSM 29435 TaxID=1869167 RepID=UPI00087218CB|nr:thiamine pyrophosphate-dependent enzyme [Humibacillus sp. DSM 29435]OFE15007.1 MFS transporter [Humibacillus sp. DSM 29435]
MTEQIDEHFLVEVQGWSRPFTTDREAGRDGDQRAEAVSPELLFDLFEAQLLSRHLDFAARSLQALGEGFYTIGSSGHESNAAVALSLHPSDPALLHYRSGGFYCARAGQVPGTDAALDVLRSLTCSVDDPISGGRHKVFGHPELAIIPQTSTIASHLPRALGMAFALDQRAPLGVSTPVPPDAVVVASLGDASVNHSTAVGALNAAGHIVHRGTPLPLLLICEDNGIGISVRTPPGWTRRALQSLPGIRYLAANGTDPEQCLTVAREAAEYVRTHRQPVVLHLSTVRLMGHAGSDVELAYRSRRQIDDDVAADPLVATARVLHDRGLLSSGGLVDRYEQVRRRVADVVEHLLPAARLDSAEAVMRPLTERSPIRVRAESAVSADDRPVAFRGKLPEDAGPLTLAQSINAALTDLMATHRDVLVFGEDVGAKGGVYGVTRGLRTRFGARRVFDTLLDEQTILGTALGSALAGFLPVPEIQYLAYLHNAEDQLRGEAATLRFFSNGQYGNGMLVRVPGLAYQKGFGGHFHNDNSLTVLRDIPGIVVAVPSSAAEAPRLVRALAALARCESRVCVLVEPIALYHSRDLRPGDGAWSAAYLPPHHWGIDLAEVGRGSLHEGSHENLNREGTDVLIVTFGNGVPMSLRAVAAARQRATSQGRSAPRAVVYDLRWLAPLPARDLLEKASRADRVLVVDETRRTGGVSEGVVATLVDGGYGGRISRVTSKDSIIPLGPAAATVLLSETEIVDALLGGA